MIIFCEECGGRNVFEIDQERLKAGEIPPPRCIHCNDVLRLDISKIVTQSPKLKTEKKVATEKGSRLEFFFRDSIYEVSLVRPSISMGRQKANELIIKDSRVSRVHARAEYRQGKFLIVDQSTNGTYIYIKGDKGQNIKKEEMNLHGSGVIGLGRKVELNSPEAIQFTVFS